MIHLILTNLIINFFPKNKIPLFGKNHKTDLFYIQKKNFFLKKLFHVKYFSNFKEFIYFELNSCYSLTSFTTYKPYNMWGDFYKINMFFRVKTSVNHIRWFTLKQLNIIFKNNYQINTFFFGMKYFSVLNYIWLIEWSFLLFLIKIKLSNSIMYSLFLIFSSIINHNGCFYLTRWSVVTITTPIIIIFSYLSLLQFKLNFLRFNTLYFFFISFNRYLKKIRRFYTSLYNTLPNKIYSLYYYQIVAFKYLEIDFKSLIFILLPLSNWKYFYCFIFFRWMNYWNNRIHNWKFLT